MENTNATKKFPLTLTQGIGYTGKNGAKAWAARITGKSLVVGTIEIDRSGFLPAVDVIVEFDHESDAPGWDVWIKDGEKIGRLPCTWDADEWDIEDESKKLVKAAGFMIGDFCVSYYNIVFPDQIGADVHDLSELRDLLNSGKVQATAAELAGELPCFIDEEEGRFYEDAGDERQIPEDALSWDREMVLFHDPHDREQPYGLRARTEDEEYYASTQLEISWEDGEEGLGWYASFQGVIDIIDDVEDVFLDGAPAAWCDKPKRLTKIAKKAVGIEGRRNVQVTIYDENLEDEDEDEDFVRIDETRLV